jgi:GR25 family glycosyltransferase involved in LPS biosynthesis
MNSLPDEFENFLSGPAIILSLARHKEVRYQYTLEKLTSAGFTNITYFEGTDGFVEDTGKVSSELNIKFIPRILSEKGSIGFTLSCIRIWKKIVEESLPYLIIFEDDALPEPNFKTLAKQWYDETPKKLDFMYMGSSCHNTPDTLKYLGKKVIVHPIFCTHAYVVTYEGAKKALQLSYESCKKDGVDKGDCEIISWMYRNNIIWYVWNNRGVFPISFPKGDKTKDSTIEVRDNGLIYQNQKQGSSIHCKDIVF